MVKNPPAMQETQEMRGWIPGLGRSPREGHGNPLQYSCLESRTDRRAWRAAVRGITKSATKVSTHAWMHPSLIRGDLPRTVGQNENQEMPQGLNEGAETRMGLINGDRLPLPISAKGNSPFA